MVLFKHVQIHISASPCVPVLLVRLTLRLLPAPTRLPGLDTGRCISFMSGKRLVGFLGGLVCEKQLHITVSELLQMLNAEHLLAAKHLRSPSQQNHNVASD